MVKIHFDFETRSEVDLREVGHYTYAEDPSTDVLCACWAFDKGPTFAWVMGDPPPANLLEVMKLGWIDSSAPYRVVGHNVTFEYLIWNNVMTRKYGWPELLRENTDCTMAMAYHSGLPGSLEEVAIALRLEVEKDMEGRKLMLKMCKPRKTKDGSVLWHETPEQIARLVEYCRQDVETERAVDHMLTDLPPIERQLWLLDQEINARGISFRAEEAVRAVELLEENKHDLNRKISKISGGAISSVMAVGQIGDWIKSKGVQMKGVASADVLEALESEGLPAHVRAVLELRRAGSKSSTAKIKKLIDSSLAYGRARGMFQYYGANQTGRWAGRLVQMQNLPRPTLKQDVIEEFLDRLWDITLIGIRRKYGEPMEVISSCIRGLLSSEEGKTLNAGDFANIEGRVLAWLAGYEEKLNRFRAFDAGTGPDLYLIAAGNIYHCSIKDATPHRMIGKVSELALGFGGGVGAFHTMAATYNVHVSDGQADEIKTNWRKANQPIVKLWEHVEDAAIKAVKNPGKVFEAGRCKFAVSGRNLQVMLPSGRVMRYPYPRVQMVQTPWGQEKEGLTYMTKADPKAAMKAVSDPWSFGNWLRVVTYGGKLVENITQATARDLLASRMLRVNRKFPIVLHVHDEIVTETDTDTSEELFNIMQITPPWAEGLPIAVEGWSGSRYRK